MDDHRVPAARPLGPARLGHDPGPRCPPGRGAAELRRADQPALRRLPCRRLRAPAQAVRAGLQTLRLHRDRRERPRPADRRDRHGLLHPYRLQPARRRGARLCRHNNFAFDEGSIYFAGRIRESIGAFIEGNYDGVSRKISLGKTDIRLARDATLFDEDFVLGITLNNAPTVSDLWNSTSAWGFPRSGSVSRYSVSVPLGGSPAG